MNNLQPAGGTCHGFYFVLVIIFSATQQQHGVCHEPFLRIVLNPSREEAAQSSQSSMIQRLARTVHDGSSVYVSMWTSSCLDRPPKVLKYLVLWLYSIILHPSLSIFILNRNGSPPVLVQVSWESMEFSECLEPLEGQAAQAGQRHQEAPEVPAAPGAAWWEPWAEFPSATAAWSQAVSSLETELAWEVLKEVQKVDALQWLFSVLLCAASWVWLGLWVALGPPPTELSLLQAQHVPSMGQQGLWRLFLHRHLEVWDHLSEMASSLDLVQDHSLQLDLVLPLEALELVEPPDPSHLQWAPLWQLNLGAVPVVLSVAPSAQAEISLVAFSPPLSAELLSAPFLVARSLSAPSLSVLSLAPTESSPFPPFQILSSRVAPLESFLLAGGSHPRLPDHWPIPGTTIGMGSGQEFKRIVSSIDVAVCCSATYALHSYCPWQAWQLMQHLNGELGQAEQVWKPWWISLPCNSGLPPSFLECHFFRLGHDNIPCETWCLWKPERTCTLHQSQLQRVQQERVLDYRIYVQAYDGIWNVAQRMNQYILLWIDHPEQKGEQL